MKILDRIGKQYATDKCSDFHDYLNKYEKYLPFSRNEKMTILEIGVYTGNSLKMWADYYYNSIVIGIDINPECKQYETDRIKIEIGDQSDDVFLKRVSDKYNSFNLIVDDGSHISEHMLKSFVTLFDSLSSSSVYIIEDVCCTYWPEYNGGNIQTNVVMNYFHGIINEINFFGEKIENAQYCARKDSVLLEQFNKKQKKYLGTNIESINFINSAILITKR